MIFTANKKESEGIFFMANGRILRGEVYWVSVDDSVGSEIQTGRPAVVVSGNKANELLPTVIVAYITSQGKPSPTSVSVKYENEFRRVVCNQIRTIDKQRLTRYMFTLQPPELIRVTGALAGSLCIPLATAVKEEPAEDPEKTALKAECDMWKRLYNVTLDQLVEIKVNSDISRRMAEYEEEVLELEPVVEPDPVIEEPEPEQPKVEFEPDPELIDINSCVYADLKHLGFSVNIALTIIEGRPYKSIQDLRKLNGMTSIMFQLVEKKICCNPVATAPVEEKVEEPAAEEAPVVEEPIEEQPVEETPEETPEEAVEKVNINAATWKELMSKLGIIEPYACYITGHRRKNGLFTNLEELRDVKGLPKVFYERYKDKLFVGEGVPVVEKPVVKESTVEHKVNINTATAKELIEKLNMPACDAYSITGYRNKNGRFVEIEELLEVKQITPGKYERYKDRIVIVDGEVLAPEEEKPVMRKEAFGGKVNVNTATVEEICTATGMGLQTAQAIVGYRNTHGLYAKLEDLLKVSRFGNGCMRTYGDMLTVGETEPVEDEDEEEESEQESGKVNINRANIHDLMKLGFEKRAAALIVNERKKFGNYRSVDELSEIPEISGKILRKLRDKLEV